MPKLKVDELEEKVDSLIARADKDGIADNIISKISSRKLLVWTVASVALFMSQIQSEDWVAISLAYIGSQALVDLAAKWRSAGSRR